MARFYVMVEFEDGNIQDKQELVDHIDFSLTFPGLTDTTVWSSLEDFLHDNVLDSLAATPID